MQNVKFLIKDVEFCNFKRFNLTLTQSLFNTHTKTLIEKYRH